MKLETFIKRPILSSVISVLIVLVGVLSAMSLPIERYPDIAPPTISVTTNFYGASAETIIKSVITPLEDNIKGVENMLYMNSTASNSGEAEISVVFRQGTDPDMASVNVQNRVQKATSLMPSEVKSVGITVEKKQNSMLQVFSVYSPDDTYDIQFLANYCSLNIEPKIMLITGIGKFQMLSSQYSMRVWLDPAAMAQHFLNPSDVTSVLASQNIEAAAGTLGADSDETYQYTMRYTGRLKSAEEFENIVIKSMEDGTVLRLGQVAKVELGIEMYNLTGETDGHPGVMCIAYQSAGSNATQVNNDITALLEEIEANAPSGVEIVSIMNTNDFLYAAIDQVIETLRDAIILVILIVLMFLKDFRSTLIPFISIMVSLIGTFAFMTVAGFSINLLTLFALVLVIGTVVDDSIVVVEAVHAQFEHGVTSPFKATVGAVSEVCTPVLTSSLVFMAVFIPVSFTGGTSGVFYQQFGLTMAVAVGISALNALTLVPAMSALLLKPIAKPEEGKKMTFQQKYAQKFDGFFERFGKGYQKGLTKMVDRKPIIWLVIIIGFVALAFLLNAMPSGLVPNEDQCILIAEVSTPPGTSLHSTDEVAHELSAKILAIPGISDISTTAGWGFISGASSSSAVIMMKLDHWSKRGGETSLASLYTKVAAAAAEFPEASTTVFSLPMIPGYGTSNGIDMYVQDRTGGTIQDLYAVTQEFVQKINASGLSAYMAFNVDFPQWEVSVDPAKCMRSGLTVSEVMSAVGSYFGTSYVSDVNLFSKVYKVMVQAAPEDRRDETALNSTYIRTSSGEMAPLSNFVNLKKTYGAESIKTFNKFTAINVSVQGSGDALGQLKQIANETLPEGYTIDFAGMSREQNEQGGLGMILVLCIFIIYLILASLYESLVIPFAVLLSVPLGLAGSYGISYLVGLDNNIYLQTGVIMLIGLLSKTAILITEYAVDRHKKGMDIKQAAIEAAGARLRPIIMTAATMVIGLFPLVTAVGGVGGMGNFSLGIGTIVGMLIGTVGLLYITPVLYTTFQKMQDKIKKEDIEDEK